MLAVDVVNQPGLGLCSRHLFCGSSPGSLAPTGVRVSLNPMMLLLSPVLLLLFRVVLFEASQGIIQDSGYYHHNDPELGLTFAGQRTVFDSTGKK